MNRFVLHMSVFIFPFCFLTFVRLPAGHAASTSSQSALGRAGWQLTGGLWLRALLISDGLVDAENQAAGLGGGLEGVDLDQSRLPDKALNHVGDTFVLEINTGPGCALAVLHAQFVEDIGGVEAGIVAQLAGDDLQSLGKGLDDGLLLVLDVLVGVLMQVGRDLHLDGTATANHHAVLNSTLDNHDGVVQRALNLGDKLLSATAQHQRAGLGLGAVLEKVESLATNLALLKDATGAEMLVQDVGAGRLNDGTGGLDDALHILRGDTASAEDVAVSKVLRGEIANGKLREDYLGTSGGNGLELLVDDLPFGVDNSLIVGDLLNTDFGIVLFGLELELDVQAHNLGLLESLGLLLKTGVREGLLESDTVDEARLGEGAAGNFLDANQLVVQIVLVEREDGVDNHYGTLAETRLGDELLWPTLCEELSVAFDELAGHGSAGQLVEGIALVGVVGGNSNLLDLVDGQLGGSSQTLDNDL